MASLFSLTATTLSEVAHSRITFSQKGIHVVFDFFQFLWAMFVIFIFFAYLMLLFSIITDLFRDHQLNGWLKALWFIFLIFIPIITALIYIIARGRGIAERSAAAAQQAESATADYIRNVAGTSAADQIANAKQLLDSGAITKEEFEALKKKALA